MKIYSFFATCLAITMSASALAATPQRTISEMQSIASATLAERYSLPVKAPQSFRVAAETTTYCVLTNELGAVIVNKDAGQEAVLGYSNSAFDPDNVPCGLEWWLKVMDATLRQPATGKAVCRAPKQLPTSVSPLVNCHWGQGSPYNSQCPNGAQVGCVAVAMGQVMYANSFPYRGIGSHSYSNGGQQLEVDFGNTTYNWGQMNDNEIAKLLYHCGVAADMDYASGSITYTSNAATALSQYFRYKSDARYISRSSYSTSEWTEILFSNLAAGHPVIYRGTQESATSSSGHSFVIDGYDASGNVHVNWGWKGNMDGYFDLSTLQLIYGDSYQYNQAMVCDIIPSEPLYLSLDLGGGGLVNLMVENGDSYEFSIIPDEGYVIDYVSFNSNDVTNQLDANNTFVTPSLTANSTLKVVVRSSDDPGQIVGDANGDGTVNVSDYVNVANYILEQHPDPFVFEAADVDGNGEINVSDLVLVANIALTYEGAPMLNAPAPSATQEANINMNVTASRNGDGITSVTVDLDNSIALTALQMDISLPQGLSVTGATLTDRAARNHQVEVAKLANGNHRLLLASGTSKAFKGSEGALLTLTLSGEPQGTVTLGGIKLASPDGQCFTVNDLFLSPVVTGVDDITAQSRIYGEAGNIVIESPVNGTAQLVLPNGMSRTVKVKAGRNIYPAPATGLVIVRAGEKAVKLIF